MKSKTPSVATIIEQLGGPAKTAAKLGISNPSVVWNWRKRDSIPPRHAIAIEGLTGISRHKLRPDIFGSAS
jgi:DNA-binding transcriptional regulator YdaS (Cro superfamily)